MFYALLGDRPEEKGESDGMGHGARSKGHVDERSDEIPHSGRARTLRKTKDKSHKKKGTDRKEITGWQLKTGDRM